MDVDTTLPQFPGAEALFLANNIFHAIATVYEYCYGVRGPGRMTPELLKQKLSQYINEVTRKDISDKQTIQYFADILYVEIHMHYSADVEKYIPKTKHVARDIPLHIGVHDSGYYPLIV
jgi:hypothetical protein